MGLTRHMKYLFLLSAAAHAVCIASEGGACPKRNLEECSDLYRVAYWGQNSVHFAGGQEAPLGESCLYHDVVIVSFILPATDPLMPYTINNSMHGGHEPGVSSGMDVIGADVAECRAAGVLVFAAIGGATAEYVDWVGMDAAELGELFFRHFVDPGTDNPYGVPFDGIDLNVEKTSTGWPTSNWKEFGEAYKALASASPVHGYLTTAPQAPEHEDYNPLVDAHIGWATLSTPGLFDHLYIQYYNNPGSPAQPGDWSFEESTESWCNLGVSTGAYTMIGMPAHFEGAGPGNGDGYYVESDVMGDHFAVIHTHECNMGGFMVWDSGMDIMNVEVPGGSIYTERLEEEWLALEPCPNGPSGPGGPDGPDGAAWSSAIAGVALVVILGWV